MTMRWIWLVPSTICSTLASRMYRSDREVLHVAVAAEHLDRVGGDPHRGVGGEQLRHGGLGPEGAAPVAQPGRVQVERAGRATRRWPCRPAGTTGPGTRRSGGRTAGAPWRTTTARSSAAWASPTAQAAMPSRPESSAPSAILKPSPFGADQPLGRDPRAVEDDLRRRGGVGPHLALGGGGGEARRVPASASRQVIPRGPSSEVRAISVVEVGHAPVGDPRLGAVDDVRVAVRDGPGRQRGRVGPDCGSDRQ